MKLSLGAMALGACLAAQAAAPVIGSLSKNGVLVCTNLAPGSVASLEWASAVTGPWTNNWAGLGDFFAEVESKAGLKPKTFRNYQSAFRTIVSGAFKLADEKSKFDGRGGGAKKWAAAIDAIKLAAVTPDHVHKWKVAFIRAAGTSPLKEASAIHGIGGAGDSAMKKKARWG